MVAACGPTLWLAMLSDTRDGVKRAAYSALHAAAEAEEGQAEQHRAGEAQDGLQQLAPYGQHDLVVGEGQGGPERVQQARPYETGRGGTVKPAK